MNLSQLGVGRLLPMNLPYDWWNKHPAIPAILGYCLDPRVLPWCHIWCHIVPLLRWRTCDVLSRNISETSSASGDSWSQTANFSGAPKPRSFDSRFRDLTSRHLRAVLSIHQDFWKRKVGIRWAFSTLGRCSFFAVQASPRSQQNLAFQKRRWQHHYGSHGNHGRSGSQNRGSQATQEAFERAGMKVMRILDEPTAAAIAYNLHKGATRGCDMAMAWLKTIPKMGWVKSVKYYAISY